MPGATCLSRALALRFLLQAAGIQSTLWIGVGRSPAVNFEAHAWLEADGRVLLGGGKGENLTPLAAIEDGVL
jgi:hypothetical protein